MKIRNELKAGLFIIISAGLVFGLIFIMGRERQIFAAQTEFYTTFQDVKGLAVGAPVRLGGIPIGRVANVGFSRDLTDFRVQVTLLINDDFLERVKQDSVVSIETQGLLGDRFVSISPGSQVSSLPPGARLASVEVADFGQILSRAQAAVDNTSAITERINKSLEGLTPETFAHLGDAAESISKIFHGIESEKGFIHRLIYSEKDGARLVDSLSKASQDITTIIGEIRSGGGLLHALVFGENGQATSNALVSAAENISVASKNLSDLLASARDGKGLMHDLIYTEVQPGSVARRTEEILQTLNQTALNLQAASDALSKGSGTLGALLVDPSLYDNLVEVTDGAKRSFLLRQAIRSTLKK